MEKQIMFLKILVLGLFIIIGCGDNDKLQTHQERLTLPPDYKMLCDGDGHYVPTMPGGTRLYKSYPHIPYNDRQKAIKRAWRQYNFVGSPPDTVNWYDCTGMVDVN